MKTDQKNKKVFVAMSGGVDSSVVTLLLKKQGYDVTGVFMRCYNLDGCAERDARDARLVAEKLGIPFLVWDFEEEYKKRVVDYMIRGYKRGITPNPDVMCNREIKFGLFLERALKEGADYVATGHYVRLVNSEERMANCKKNEPSAIGYGLFAAQDMNKDQSYFLWTLTQKQLKHCLFPIGDYLKSEVREIARKAGLPTAEKKDSQGICFLGRVKLDEFLKTHIPPKTGQVRLVIGDGLYRNVGEHDGAHFYTIGQRRGLDSGSWGVASGRGNREPVYVAAKNARANTLTVAEGNDNPALYCKEVVLTGINFITLEHSHILKNMRMLSLRVLARVRYRQPLAAARLVVSNQRSVIRGQRSNYPITDHRLLFTNPVKFIAPGQSAVFYNEDGEMLGGGVIAASR